LTAVDVVADTASFRAVSPKLLFRTGPPAGPGGKRYDVAPDGNRFLIGVPVPPPPPQPIMVLVNWIEQLKQREFGRVSP
jgi:hypothetical protein